MAQARRHAFAALIMIGLAGIAGPSIAQQKAHDHSAQPVPQAAAAPAAAKVEMSDGEVRRVDRDAGKITLRHGEIKHLDMPPMTMVFQVKDPALLERVKAGDKIRFRVEKSPNGLLVTAVELR